MGSVWRRRVEMENKGQLDGNRTTQNGITPPGREEAPAAPQQRQGEPHHEEREDRRQRELERAMETGQSQSDSSYVEGLTGKKTPPRLEARQEEDNPKERPWEVVRSKKRGRTPPLGERSRHTSGKSNHQRPRHSPPRKRTASGLIEVYGKCRLPRHFMSECRRVEVCRRCERSGHREKRCPMPPLKLGTNQAHGGGQTAKNRGKAKEEEPLKAKDLPLAGCHKGDRRGGLGIPPPDDGEENHHVSLAALHPDGGEGDALVKLRRVCSEDVEGPRGVSEGDGGDSFIV
ncbi:hypothetical protein J5N97_030003 [Dioscorea zingiberensis]|uniref:CCHC-type domain-containing protein n=1 Tax=Dioscorea zingiberensis TaxID=325984 RepID=A0A9D5H3M4_9LILI|nr:hypothetical protein J5N97_030003 [Dioscorea zingiberensis]